LHWSRAEEEVAMGAWRKECQSVARAQGYPRFHLNLLSAINAGNTGINRPSGLKSLLFDRHAG
jgi:hypothetical protein